MRDESCRPIARREERAIYLRDGKLKLNYNYRVAPFIRRDDRGDAIEVRQDGRQKHGRPMRFPLKEAPRTVLSSITTSEFPHLYALREALLNIRFLAINPQAARHPDDRLEDRTLKPDASNLAAVLAHLKEETGEETRPDGVLSDISADLAALIPSVRSVKIRNDRNDRQYSFSLEFNGDLNFSSRVISDGTIRLLALLTVLNDPRRRGTLCFEEPENGVHEGRVPMLVEFLRGAASVSTDPAIESFQILLNTHSPRVMAALQNHEIVAADSVVSIDPTSHVRATKTRMRPDIQSTGDMFDPERHLSRFEVERLLQTHIGAPVMPRRRRGISHPAVRRGAAGRSR